jgi:hypothetical protein
MKNIRIAAASVLALGVLFGTGLAGSHEARSVSTHVVAGPIGCCKSSTLTV